MAKGQGLPRRRQTLDELIQQGIARGGWMSNAWVTTAGFSEFYARLTRRAIDTEVLYPVLNIANITARVPGAGAFTKLVARLREEYPTLHLFVEQTHARFAAKLIALGFTKLNPEIYGDSYLLKARETKHVEDDE